VKRHSTAVCTVVTLNHAHFAVTLMESISANHWEVDKYVFFVDGEDKDILGASRTGHFIALGLDRVLPVAPLTRLFRYSAFEMTVSTKPDAIIHLLGLGYDKVIYLDADTFVTGSGDPILPGLDSHDAIVTPHITKPLGKDHHPKDLDIVKAGTFNSGFLAFRRTQRATEFLKWWREKLATQCLSQPKDGLVADQKWLDLIPALFPSFHVDRSAGLNVAYWNLSHRDIETKDGAYFVDDTPLIFFHFSGAIPEDVALLSKYDGRFTTIRLPEPVKELLRDYHGRLMRNGLHEFSKRPYSYDLFGDGRTFIAPPVRKLYRENEAIRDCFGDNPFDLSRDPGFRNTYNRRIFGDRSPTTLLAYQIYRESDDLRMRFPLVPGRDEIKFAEWLVSVAASHYRLSEAFCDPAIDWLRSSHVPVIHRITRKVIKKVTQGPASERSGAHSQRRSDVRYGSTGLTTPNDQRRGHCLAGKHRERTFTMAASVLRRPLVKRVGTRLLNMGYDISAMTRAHRKACRGLIDTDMPALNVVGWLKAETGLGESARSTIRAATAAGLPVFPMNLSLKCDAQMVKSVPFHVPAPSSAPRPVTVINVNGNIFPAVIHELGEGFLRDHYNIAYWVWELQEFPEAWLPFLPILDEIWAPSTFSQEALSRGALIPVLRIPHNVDPEVPSQVTRKDLGLPDDRYIFFHCTDFHSVPERKNPLGVLEAFVRAFGPRSRRVLLCMKIGHAEQRPDVMKSIDEYVESSDNVLLIKGTLSRPHMNALIGTCDCFVSLHRAEGFGLGIAEAMCLGKPAIATGWSGNMDFMNVGNSFPVRYDMVELASDVGPFKAGQRWAEPDLDHAAQLMAWQVKEPNRSHQTGQRAMEEIRRGFSPASVGKIMLQRVRRIMHSL
jgi:glycosyltransferase involved in cell wall biosynthesis